MIKKIIDIIDYFIEEVHKRPFLLSLISLLFTLIVEKWLLRKFKFLSFLARKNLMTYYTLFTYAKKWLKILKKA